MSQSDDWKTPAGRLREEGVREIRRRREAGDTLQSIASAMGLSIGTVWNVAKRKSHAWVS